MDANECENDHFGNNTTAVRVTNEFFDKSVQKMVHKKKILCVE